MTELTPEKLWAELQREENPWKLYRINSKEGWRKFAFSLIDKIDDVEEWIRCLEIEDKDIGDFWDEDGLLLRDLKYYEGPMLEPDRYPVTVLFNYSNEMIVWGPIQEYRIFIVYYEDWIEVFD